jgi:uncharacterized protein YndB with AHSA1/START domain
MGQRRRGVTWLYIAGGALVGAPLLASLVGAMLPRDHLARMSIHLAASPDTVWSLVADFSGTARWRPEVTAVEMQPSTDGRVRFVEVSAHGRTPFEVVAQERPSKQVIRVMDEGLPYGGTWTWELMPTNPGTQVVISEAGFTRSPLFRVMSRFFFPATRTMDGYLRALAKELGEAVEPTVERAR